MNSYGFHDPESPCGDFLLPDGSIFDLDIGLGDPNDLPEEFSYSELLSETKDRLSKYGYKPSTVHSFAQLASEVGDDELGVFSHPVPAAMTLVIYQWLGMELSEEDTSLNPRFGNFAEDLVVLPDGYEQTYHFCRQTTDFRNMSFLDVPKIRLAIDIRPGRMTHSSTNDGKCGILGSRLAWLPRDSPIRGTWEVFNLYQDINLGLIRDDKFAYLPTALGGYGKPVPFGLESNFERFARSYRQGEHQQLARILVRRTNKQFERYKVRQVLVEDPVLSKVARLQSGFHDWIKGKTLYSPSCWTDAPPEVKQYRVAKHGLDVSVDASLRKLQSEGYLVTEGDLEITYEHNLLCKYLLGAKTHASFKASRKEARESWRGLSIHSLRLYGYIQPYILDQTEGRPLRPHEYEAFWLNITSRRIHLRSFLRQEDFYEKAAKDLLYLNGPMMVRVPLYPQVTQVGRRQWYETTKDTCNVLEDRGDLQKLLDWVKSGAKGLAPVRTIIEDDPIIIKEASLKQPDTGLAIVTDDVRLCRDTYNHTKLMVCRVPVAWYYLSVYYGEGDEPWLAKLRLRFPFVEWETIQDTGSIESYAEIGFRDGLPIDRPIERRFFLWRRSFGPNLKRIREKAEEAGELAGDWEPHGFPEEYTFSPGHFLQRKKHPYRRGLA
jgi:hypothetical protein